MAECVTTDADDCDMTASVACVGIAVTDQIYRVGELPSKDTKIRASSLAESGGGMAAGAAVAAARLGGRATWFGRVGDDDQGSRLLGYLAREGVDTRHSRRIRGARTPHSVVLVDPEGNRAIVAYGADVLDPGSSWLPLDAITAHDAVLADIRWLEGAVAALSAARARGRPAVLDADSSSDPAALDAVAAASHAVFSEQGLDDLFGHRDLESALRCAAGHAVFVAVTLGARGVAWLDPTGSLRCMSAPAIEASETLGAGDVFHGAFALALAEGLDDEPALAFATTAATLKCTRSGGWASFPVREEVEEQLPRRG
jgi:sulfofructose kinase